MESCGFLEFLSKNACDAYVLTVFPFGEDDEVPEGYEAVNYASGMYRGEPALARYEGEAVREVLVVEQTAIENEIPQRCRLKCHKKTD